MSGALAIGVYGVMVLSVVALALRRPGAALIMASCMFALKQWAQASGGVFAAHPSLTNWIAGAIVLGGVLLHLARGQLRLFACTREFWLILGLYFYSLVSIAWAPLIDVSFRHWREALPYIGTMIVLAPLLVQSPRDLTFAYGGLLVIGTLLALLLLFTVPWDGRQIVLRYSGSDAEGGNPLTVGQLGGTLLILGVLYRGDGMSLILTLLKWGAAFVGLALVAKSASRGQLGAALLVAGAFWAIATPKKNTLKPVLAVVGMVALIALAVVARNHFLGDDRRFETSQMETDFAGRLGNAGVVLAHWAQSPVSMMFGIGNSASFDPRILGIYPHIVPVEILAEEGVVGFALFAAALFATAVAAIRELRDSSFDPGRRNLFVCLLALWTYSFFLINKQGSLLLSQDFFLNSILLVSYRNLYSTRREPAPARVQAFRPENLLA